MIFKKHILDLVEICYRKGIRYLVISPGSRSAPITLAFAKYHKFKDFIILDERSAAYIALGIAEETNSIVALICTSGTAVLNYAPAISEAYYKRIPLLILTADRPIENIDQYDNQTIRQNNIYNNYILASYNLPIEPKEEDNLNYSNRIVNEALNKCLFPVKGPVHINIPLREPLYPKDNEEFIYDKKIKIINQEKCKYKIDNIKYFKEKWNKYKKRMILCGMDNFNLKLENTLKKLKETNSCVIIGDILSSKEKCLNVYNHDFIFNSKKVENLIPELLITIGTSIVSKSTKNILKKFKPKEHWHIRSDLSIYGDLYNSLTEIVNSDIADFFNSLKISKEDNQFVRYWKSVDESVFFKINNFFDNEKDFNEFLVIKKIIDYLPNKINLHIGNSMVIRYFSLLSIRFLLSKNIKIFSNRGTSGIDGVLSTAVGHSLVSDRLNIVILGDLSFIYDYNGIINNYVNNKLSKKISNLKIIILNNNGGGIFDMIEGPSKFENKIKYFNTPQNYPIEFLAFGFEYFSVSSMLELEKSIEYFFKSKNTTILEIKTDMKKKQRVF
ncbi:MAG: 2-succinyl-5-enolpyruvyl-6-hydroxy-3-cyclohexene-1-carboxylate synthase [Candidatus Sericytochromatia bacterium]|nr:MAG: 2-succinyl-5-enolpyruvyl-6-hydroxy-3-cyclohexene-1-carboxylate synthase [Candidatus Sericytochromatia bacterium]